MKLEGKRVRSLAVFSLVLGVLCACSGGGQKGDSASEDFGVCDELLGFGRVNAVQDEMGGGAVEVLDSVVSVDGLIAKMADTAQSWKPSSGTAYSLSERPCDLLVEAKGGNGVFRSSVNWSLLSLGDVKNEANSDSGDWRSIGEDVFVETEKRGVSLSVIIPCAVEGARKDQISQIPLEVGTSVTNAPGFDGKLLSEMTTHLTRKLVEGLRCENHPKVPSISY